MLREAFAAAGLPAEIEVYADACTAGARPIPPSITKRRRTRLSRMLACSRPPWPEGETELPDKRPRRDAPRSNPDSLHLR